ncbi:MAG: PD-(D/E)XK nuclease family protein [Clostridiales bacterium]|nr:PD-(D/E)XK nuclease family protein [Clostridiales bacterium]
MPVFSISRISTYDACPLQYKFAYIDCLKVEAEDTVETFLGRIVHEALEKLYRDKMHEKLLSADELLDFFRRTWEKKWQDSIIIVRNEYTAENYKKMGERYLADYYNRHKPFERGRVLGLETKDQLPLDEPGQYFFHIRIDRLIDMGDGLYEVHDYKTSSQIPKEQELETDEQLAMYALWVKRRFKDFKKARLVWHYLAFDKEMDSFRTPDQLEGLREEILVRIKEIEAAREFPPVVSHLCDWCLYKSVCPMWRHGVELEAMPENEYLNDPGVKLVDEYAKLKSKYDDFRSESEEKLEKIKQALIAFCEREGVSVVFGSENKVTVKEQESLRFPAKNTDERKKLVDILKQVGKWEDVAELDVFALSRALKNREWDEALLEGLKGFGVVEKSYRLTLSRK